MFQIVDDILDVTSTTEELGKPVGSDAENDKTTFITLYGLDRAQPGKAATMPQRWPRWMRLARRQTFCA